MRLITEMENHQLMVLKYIYSKPQLWNKYLSNKIHYHKMIDLSIIFTIYNCDWYRNLITNQPTLIRNIPSHCNVLGLCREKTWESFWNAQEWTRNVDCSLNVACNPVGTTSTPHGNRSLNPLEEMHKVQWSHRVWYHHTFVTACLYHGLNSVFQPS